MTRVTSHKDICVGGYRNYDFRQFFELAPFSYLIYCRVYCEEMLFISERQLWSPDCCGASVASEQQHKQDLRRIYKRENEFSKSSLFIRILCAFLPECIAPFYQNALRLLPDCIAPRTTGAFFAWIAVETG